MLHEILFAMLGKVGNIILEMEDGFKINPMIDFISEGEKDLVEKLVSLGFYFLKIKEFTDEDKKAFNARSNYFSLK